MRAAQKPDHITLNNLINRLKEGRFVIPDFQREFEWQAKAIRELMKSIFLDYYIGSLLLWKGKKENFEALSCEPIYGYKGNGSPEHIVLDGQQRLSAMYYAFLFPDIPLSKHTNRFMYFIQIDKFMSEEYDEAFQYDWLKNRWLSLINDRAAQYAGHIFPLSIIGKGGWELPNWVQGYEKFWETKTIEAHEKGDTEGAKGAQRHAENAKAFGEHLKSITEGYQVSYIELDRDIEVEKVCDIFTQINSTGIRLDAFDLMNALLKPKGLQLKQMWRKAAPRLEFAETEKMDVYILQVMSILRQAYCSPKYLYYLLPGQEKKIRDLDSTFRKEVLVPTVDDFEKGWNQAVDAIEYALDLLKHPQEFGVISSTYLPYVSILPAFAAIRAYAKSLPANRQLDAHRKIRHWYWASVFTNRYSGSVESTTARDYLDLKVWFDDDKAEPTPILEFKTSFRSRDLRKETKRGSSVYNGIFNLLVIHGARDWMTGDVPQYSDLDDHHIVPRSWGDKNLSGNIIHSILNRSPLSADTNRKVINERLPNEYLPELIKANGETTVHAILKSHFISPAAQSILLRDPFTPDDFEAFITERQHTIQEAIETLLVKERLDLSPHLRELDERIERIELNLRKTVLSDLDRSCDAVPSHTLYIVQERIDRALKKNAALDSEYYKTLDGKLEYFDLRELQDTITNKSLWSRFEKRFANKETLANKFDQLAELRNAIRHSRSVDQIKRKEGEAAILWFEQVINK
ncbi:MAG: DUF262 domain-containing protein [Desulfobacterium sp.]|nr:DUF262 domain-containing protein [Desulfobacterium sp.]